MSFFVAAYDWEHSGWVGEYYPDDLPEDWRLAYYANEFTAVVVPQARWCAPAADVLESWLEDTHEGFRFFLALEDPGAEAALERLLFIARLLGGRLGGVLVDAADGIDAAQWQRLFDAVGGEVDLFARFAAEPGEPTLGRLIAHGVGVAVAQGDGAWRREDGTLQAVYARGRLDPAALRALIEPLARELNPEQTGLLVLEGEPPHVPTVQQARTVVELMGL